jgi:hypothetical protein
MPCINEEEHVQLLYGVCGTCIPNALQDREAFQWLGALRSALTAPARPLKRPARCDKVWHLVAGILEGDVQLVSNLVANDLADTNAGMVTAVPAVIRLLRLGDTRLELPTTTDLP